MPKLFGFELPYSKQKKKDEKKTLSFVPSTNDDGAITVETSATASGAYAQTRVDFAGYLKSDFERITKYRSMELHPKCDSGIEDIVNDAIILTDNDPALKIDLSELKVGGKKTKDEIEEEFKYSLNLLNFNEDGYEIFRRWYVDGRLYFHAVTTIGKENEGIKELRYIDPRQIRKVRVVEKKEVPETGVEVVTVVDEFYVYNPQGITHDNLTVATGAEHNIEGMRIEKDAIIYVHSGILNEYSQTIYSHLERAIKPLNQLQMMEDAIVIYRITRAPERRVFYIDVGSLPTRKAETHMKQVIANYRSKMVYDQETGQIRDDRRHLSMLEDFFLARKEGSQGTQIDTLPGGQNLGEMEEMKYFERNLYEAMKVPISRLQPDTGFVLGRSTEITRDEVKFSKFINRLRKRFSILFNEILKRQLILKRIIRDDEWDQVKNELYYIFNTDNYYAELKNNEVMNTRLDLLDRIDPYTEKYYSKKWVREHILQQI
jgi:hypothetical protein